MDSRRLRGLLAVLMWIPAACWCGCDGFTQIRDRLETVVLDDIETITETSSLPRELDPDQDDLSTEEEVQIGTDPNEADTDGDLVPDHRELELGTDPLTFDSEHTRDGVPSAFDGLIVPGASRTFFRGPNAIATAYVRIMALVRTETKLRLEWRTTDTENPRATTELTFQPRQYWCWGHDLGPAAIISEPIDMTLAILTVNVEEGDSVFFSFISSGGLTNGPRGFVPFSPILAEAAFDFNLVMAHGAFRDAGGWDSFVMMLERIAPEVGVIRTSVDPQGMIERRAGQLSRFIQREGLPNLYAIAHSQGGLDARYILTEAAMGDPHYSVTAASLCGLYTLGTPHRGLTLTPLTEDLPDDLFAEEPPMVPDPEGQPLPGNPSAATIDTMNEAFPGDVTIGDRVIPVVAFTFHADFHPLTASDGIVKLASQAWGDHVINDTPSPRAGGPGSGRHVISIPSRSEVEQDNFFVLGRMLEDIVTRRAATDGSNPCP